MSIEMTNSRIQLIGIHGHAGAGKDSIGRYLCEFYKNTYREAFADPLKAACSHAFGIPIEYFNDPEFKGEPNMHWGVSPRQIAQFVGTEMFRDLAPKLLNQSHEERWSFWVWRMWKRIFAELHLEDEGAYEQGDTVVITDVRFNDEVDMILSEGGIIIDVKRSGYEGNVGILQHRSEAGIEVSDFTRHYLIQNDGTLPQLFEKVDQVLEQAHINHSIILERE